MNYFPEGYSIDNGSFELEQTFYQELMAQSAHALRDKLMQNSLINTFLECPKGSSKKDIKEVLYKYCDAEIDSWHHQVVNDQRFKGCSVRRIEDKIIIMFNIINSVIHLDIYADLLDVEINQ